MLEQISFEQLKEWYAFWQVEPFGQEYRELGAGIISATLCNLKRDPKRQKEPYKASDFMPVYEAQDDGHTKPSGDTENAPGAVKSQVANNIAAFFAQQSGGNMQVIKTSSS